MGQVALGFRSLLIKLAVFVAMASLLAWALGGTLFPRPHVADLLDGPSAIDGDTVFYWRITVAARHQERADWKLMKMADGAAPVEADSRTWRGVAGPVAQDDAIYFGGRDETGQWRLVRLGAGGRSTDSPMPDRLAVEKRLARVAAGQPMDDEAS